MKCRIVENDVRFKLVRSVGRIAGDERWGLQPARFAGSAFAKRHSRARADGVGVEPSAAASCA